MIMLQVMGAPLAGSDVRAQVVTGGGLRLKALHPSLRSRRLHMIFPLRGARHRGLVSVEVKRRRVRTFSRFCQLCAVKAIQLLHAGVYGSRGPQRTLLTRFIKQHSRCMRGAHTILPIVHDQSNTDVACVVLIRCYQSCTIKAEQSLHAWCL